MIDGAVAQRGVSVQKLTTSRVMGVLLLTLALPLLVWQLGVGAQIALAPTVFMPMHSILEISAVVMAALVFFTGAGTAEIERSMRAMELGGAFLAVAIFDAFHFLSYPGMPDMLVGLNSEHKSFVFWLLARYSAGLGLLAYILLSERATPVSYWGRKAWLIALLVLIVLVAWVPMTAPERIASMYQPGVGATPLKIGLEWGAFVLYLSAALVLLFRRKKIVNCDCETLLMALFLLSAGELFFTLQTRATGVANLLAHGYKLAAYYYLYRAIYSESVNKPFRRMRYTLTHDALTHLPNRMRFGQKLNHALAYATSKHSPCAIVLLNIDRFQNINDTLGHEQGDNLLMLIAKRIKESLPAGAFAARFSGDEFAILLQDTSRHDAQQMAQALLHVFSEAFELGEDNIAISVSMGLTCYPDDTDNASVLMRYADLALRQAKRNGRNCVAAFSKELGEGFQRQVALETHLRGALARKEFELHYQPKWEIESGKLYGWEALLRWHSPILGQVSPDEFIAVAERTGLILPLGEWVLYEACRQLRAWRAAGLPAGTMAVNLSARQFRQRDIADEVGRVLLETGVLAEELELEITESVLMDDLDSAVVALDEMKQLGVRIAIDDFGTGHSSLAYLKSLPIHCLKIDRAFIADIPNNPNGVVIVRSILALARSLGLTVVAEGVENQAQFSFLRDNQCDQAQGYLFFRPLPASECFELLQACQKLAETEE
jgi:diguanylate cyclase